MRFFQVFPVLHKKTSLLRCLVFGGEDGIRTHAPVTQPNGLANRPLEPLEYFSGFNDLRCEGVLFPMGSSFALWRRGWDSNPCGIAP